MVGEMLSIEDVFLGLGMAVRAELFLMSGPISRQDDPKPGAAQDQDCDSTRSAQVRFDKVLRINFQ